MSKLAAIRIRGGVRASKELQHALRNVKLDKKHACVILEKNPVNEGMLRKVAQYITWGDVNEETLKKLGDRKTLSPPRKGYSRIGLKKNYKAGGDIGNRGEAINELIVRMTAHVPKERVRDSHSTKSKEVAGVK